MNLICPQRRGEGAFMHQPLSNLNMFRVNSYTGWTSELLTAQKSAASPASIVSLLANKAQLYVSL